jgi:hypothetical protein
MAGLQSYIVMSYACGLEMEVVTGGKIEDVPSWAILVIHGKCGVSACFASFTV